MKTWALGLTLAATFILSACGGPRAFTRGEYGDPNEISMLDDKWNQNDMQLVAKKMIGSMEGWIDGRAVEKPVEIHDLHATMLHLMGIDHERLTVRFGGRDMRLTDVHGKVMHDWIA